MQIYRTEIKNLPHESNVAVDFVPVVELVAESAIVVVAAAGRLERFAVECYPVEWWIDFVWPACKKTIVVQNVILFKQATVSL